MTEIQYVFLPERCTVSALINALSTFPQDVPVYVLGVGASRVVLLQNNLAENTKSINIE